MQIVCPTCSKRLQIPDDKLPADRQVRLTCPACQERFVFDPQDGQILETSSGHSNTAAAPPTVPVPHPSPAPAAAPTGSLDMNDAGPAPRALVCLDNAAHRETFQEILPGLGYHTVHIPAQQFQAFAYLSQIPYECFILDALFDGSTLEANPVLTCVADIAMERRRYMFVALCAPDITTADGMLAYSWNVNLVLNYAEVPASRRFLEQYMTEHKRLYKVYRELRQQLGKDA
jgi:CheY-like chemotaxis protein